MKLLILGGTAEAAALARAVAARLGESVDMVSSLAGRAGVPDLPGRVRVGGFGGAAGLEAYLRSEGVEAVVDATHPFAANISVHAEAACAAAGVMRLVLARPDWPLQDGDRWIMAESMAAAAMVLPGLGQRAFLTVGAGEVAAFAPVADVWFLVRLLTDAVLPLAHYETVIGRGPFAVEDEARLLEHHRIDVVVSKAAGGIATYGKIAAARALGLPVLMVSRPFLPNGHVATTLAMALEWVEKHAG
jgi:precorrin-6A/cobalt-precorrin-6A reductase